MKRNTPSIASALLITALTGCGGYEWRNATVDEVSKETRVSAEELNRLRAIHKQWALSCFNHPIHEQGTELRDLRAEAGRIVPDAKLHWVCIGGVAYGGAEMATRIGDTRLDLGKALNPGSSVKQSFDADKSYEDNASWQVKE